MKAKVGTKLKYGFLFFIVAVAIIVANVFLWRIVMAPAVSVVMPVYNGEKYLDKSIPSILGQIYDDFEFIMIDDGSSDKSWEIMQKYAAQDSRIRLFKNEKNMGISYTRNRGNAEARGKYIMLMDQDDWSYPERLFKQYDYLEKHPWVDIVAVHHDNTVKHQWPDFLENTNDGIRLFLLLGNTFGHPNLMVKRAFLLKHNIKYNPKYKCANDWDWLLQIMENDGYFAVMYERLFHYSGENFSGGEDSPCHLESNEIFKQTTHNEEIDRSSVFRMICSFVDLAIRRKDVNAYFSPGFLEYAKKSYCGGN